MNTVYYRLLSRLELSNDDYKFIRAFDKPGKFFIKYSGTKIDKPKRVGFFTVEEFDFNLYSKLIDNFVVPISYIEVLSGHQRNGHCLNTIQLLIDSFQIVVSDVQDKSVWEGLRDKLSVDSYFKKFSDKFEDLVINPFNY